MASKRRVIYQGDFGEYPGGSGKWYRHGDVVPMSDAEAEHHLVFGSNTFRVESDEPRVILVSAGDVAVYPTDDAGQPIKTAATEKLAAKVAEDPSPSVLSAPVSTAGSGQR